MIRLEPFTPADFQELISWIDNEQLLNEWSGSLFSFPLTEDSLHWYIQGANDPKDPEVFIWKAVDSKTGQAVGHISLGSFSNRDQSARITRVLVGSRQQRGRGVCKGMIDAVLQVGFEQLNLHRISLGVYDFNHAAIRCYQKSGFHKEGTLRDVKRVGDEWWSLVEMSILEDEWRALHQSRLDAKAA
ncbi:GNAT family N-acetyltransferase [Hymenobacter sp. CRA2]|uniref:GNAT family N-acetyltransferase n=1 Tax=Hymenobacter sp. CRA2 TaxID=1955620 RepID=UPI00098F313E|nr:GNAT family protein [Hymenobacter sp. CRA2]OON67118.1 GNAT family N-acetyltransferase [Hymenobacter sp. CRA2]